MESISLSARPVSGYPASKGIRRCLFGPVDHQENKAALNRISSMLDERDRLSWNFDFQKGTPCSGRYVWEKCPENSEDIPMAYSLPHLEAKSFTPVRFPTLSSRRRSTSPAPTSSRNSPLTMVQPLGEVTNSLFDRESSPLLARPSTPSNTSSTEVTTQSTTTSSSSTSSSRKRKHQSTIPEYFTCKKPRVVPSSKSQL